VVIFSVDDALACKSESDEVATLDGIHFHEGIFFGGNGTVKSDSLPSARRGWQRWQGRKRLRESTRPSRQKRDQAKTSVSAAARNLDETRSYRDGESR
jgi:hypothetical protein